MSDQLKNKTGLGIFLIVLGGFLLLDRMDVIMLPWFFFTWEAILITVGIYQIAVRNRWESGIIIIAIGSAFLLPDIFNVTFREIFRYWPALLIIIGVVILIRHLDENNNVRINNQDHENR